MRLNGKNGTAIFLILLGGFILLANMGLHLGGFISFILPFVLIGLGYYGIKHGRPGIGWIVMVIGIFSLLGKFSGLIGWIIAIALIWYGVTQLLNKKAY